MSVYFISSGLLWLLGVEASDSMQVFCLIEVWMVESGEVVRDTVTVSVGIVSDNAT